MTQWIDSRQLKANWKVRLTGVLLLAATAWYIPWALTHLNWKAPWLSLPFAAAMLLAAIMMVVAVINNWSQRVPVPAPVPEGQEPDVLVIIPTYGEPVGMLHNTAKSVLQQDYPQSRIRLVISDDGHRRAVRDLVDRLGREYPDAWVTYHEPPRRTDARRNGEAKAGNLNSVLEEANRSDHPIGFVETRDADDLVGDPGFLRQAIGQLLIDSRLAFVQTIKEAQVSPGDPFGNLEPLFYRRLMLKKNAANAVFPCGSGLVWRRTALNDIGGFPAWNLVEDLQSGLEALRRGWHGLYLPIIGAMGQTAPEDIPNSIKQRGTWAIDTVRLALWGSRHGLSLRQQLHFAEMGLFYMLGYAILIFAVTPIFPLVFNIHPMAGTQVQYATHLWPYVAGIELFLIALADGLAYEKLWRARQILLGMAPVYARAVIIALRYGPSRKPGYRVTRKEHVFHLYWREVLPQFLILLALAAASVYHLATHSLMRTADLGSLFWATFFVLGLGQVVRNAWHGVDLRRSLAVGAARFGQRAGIRRRADG